MSINSRTKGHNGEREIVKILQKAVDEVCEELGVERKYTLERNQNQTNKGGCDIVGIDWLSPEVKFYKKIDRHKLGEWWKQCLQQSNKGQMPVLFFRSNNVPWRVRVWGMASTYHIISIDIELHDFIESLKQNLRIDILGLDLDIK